MLPSTCHPLFNSVERTRLRNVFVDVRPELLVGWGSWDPTWL